jgi:hypothetical protein
MAFIIDFCPVANASLIAIVADAIMHSAVKLFTPCFFTSWLCRQLFR